MEQRECWQKRAEVFSQKTPNFFGKFEYTPHALIVFYKYYNYFVSKEEVQVAIKRGFIIDLRSLKNCF